MITLTIHIIVIIIIIYSFFLYLDFFLFFFYKDGEAVSMQGTHLGHNLPDRKGNRYCINLCSVAGNPTTPLKATLWHCLYAFVSVLIKKQIEDDLF